MEVKAQNQAPNKDNPTATEIQDWLISYLLKLPEIEPDKVEVDIPFDQLGLDSSEAVVLTGDLADWLGLQLDPDLLFDYPTTETLAQHLAEVISS